MSNLSLRLCLWTEIFNYSAFIYQISCQTGLPLILHEGLQRTKYHTELSVNKFSHYTNRKPLSLKFKSKIVEFLSKVFSVFIIVRILFIYIKNCIINVASFVVSVAIDIVQEVESLSADPELLLGLATNLYQILTLMPVIPSSGSYNASLYRLKQLLFFKWLGSFRGFPEPLSNLGRIIGHILSNIMFVLTFTRRNFHNWLSLAHEATYFVLYNALQNAAYLSRL